MFTPATLSLGIREIDAGRSLLRGKPQQESGALFVHGATAVYRIYRFPYTRPDRNPYEFVRRRTGGGEYWRITVLAATDLLPPCHQLADIRHRWKDHHHE